MNKAIIPAVCFIAGTAFGVFVLSRAGIGNVKAPGGGGGSGAMAIGSGGEGAKSEGRGSDRAGVRRKGSTGVGLAQLMDLCNTTNYPAGVPAIYRRIEHLDGAALRTLAEQLDAMPGGDSRQWQVRSILYQRFAEVDPDGALGYARSIEPVNIRQMAIRSVLGHMADRDLAAAIAVARSFDDPVEYQCAVSTLASANTKESSGELLRLLEERNVGRTMDWSYRQVFENWARNDPQSAIARLADVPPGGARTYALQGIANALAQTSPEAGLDWAAGLSNEQDRMKAMNTLIGGLAARDPARALAVMDSTGNAAQRRQLLGMVAAQWGGVDAAAARSWIESLPPRDKIFALQGSLYQHLSDPQWAVAQIAGLPPSSGVAELTGNFAQYWAQHDPGAVADWVCTLPQGSIRHDARRNLIQQWAHADPAAAAEFLSGETLGSDEAHLAGQVAGNLLARDREAALAWMEQLDVSDGWRANMVKSAVGDWAQYDAAAAAEYVLQLEGKVRSDAIVSLTSAWAGQDLEGAVAWTSKIEDAKERNAALGSLLSNVSGQNPERAAAIFDDGIREAAELDPNHPLVSAARSIAASWARADPVKAAEWAVDLPDSVDRPGALGAVVGRWAEVAPAEAADWVSGFDPGPERDGAVAGLVAQISNSDPNAAFLWAASIEDPDTMHTQLRQAVTKWAEADVAAARAAVEAADLSDEVRKPLLESLDKK